MNSYSSFFKRIVDIIVSLLGLIFLSPIILLASVLIMTSSKLQPFFLQERPGKNSKIFKIIKFKTMSDEKDSNGKLLTDAKRITKIGKLIRSLSLDELPQLVNVIKGDMSLVGPRPLLVKYLPLYNERQARRHEVKPGITGLSQVNGRNAISWEDKLELDVQYVENLSFWLDMKILWLTVKKVILRESVNLSDSITMTPFKGSKN